MRSRLDGATAQHPGAVFVPDMLVNIHPAIGIDDETGRRATFVNFPFTKSIDGMDEAASRELILRTVLHGTRPGSPTATGGKSGTWCSGTTGP